MAIKEHRVQVIKDGIRWIAVEIGGRVAFSKDGNEVGKARWMDEQFLESSALMPDAIVLELERLIKRAIDADYFE